MVADAITYVDIGDAAVLKMIEGRLGCRPSFVGILAGP
jgi:hypothetical protein